MDYTRILIDIDNSLRHLKDSIQQASKPQPSKSKADFIREVAPKIALAIVSSGKVDFPSVIQLALSWYNDIEEYILDLDVQEEKGLAKSINTTTGACVSSGGYMSGGYYYEFQTPDELKKSEEESFESGAGFSDIHPNEY